MKYKLYILSFAFLMSAFTLSGQQKRRVSNYIFAPEWYVGLYAGPNLVVAEGFGSTLTRGKRAFLNVIGYQVNPVIGYQLSPVVSLRAGIDIAKFNWLNVTINPDSLFSAGNQSMYLDVVLNLSNAFAYYDLNRTLDVSIFAGAGAMHRNKGSYNAPFYGLFARVGGQFDIHLTQFVDLNLRAELNLVKDVYNETIPGAFPIVDVLPAAMVGITYHFRTNKPFGRGCY